MSHQTFDTIDLLRLEIEDVWTNGLPNLIPNPSGLYGGYGWRIKPLAGTLAAIAGPALRFTKVGAFGNSIDSDMLEVTPGQHVRGRVERVGGTAGVGFTCQFQFLTATGGFAGVGAVTGAQTTNGTLDVPDTTVPAGTKYVMLRLNHTGTAGQTVDFKNVCLVHGSAGAVAVTPTVEPSYVNVMTTSTEIKVTREELNLGTLRAVVRDSTIDPATNTLIRKGKRVRLTALDAVTGLWELVFAGKAHNATVTYDLLYPKTSKRSRIDLLAVDPISILAATPRAGSVDTIANLADVLDNVGIPWNVNGSSAPITAVAPVATTANATAIDQVAMTRDTTRGYAWMSRKGIINAWDRGTMPAAVVAVINESVYTDLQLGYSTDDLLNSVGVFVRRYDAVTGDTIETKYGPYVDQISARERGHYHQDFLVTAAWTEANAATYAAALLATNPYPRVRVKTLRYPVKDAAHIIPARALIDLYDKVTVNNTAKGIAQDLRVTSIEHTISAEPAKWTVDLGFSEIGGVAAPQVVAALEPAPVDTAALGLQGPAPVGAGFSAGGTTYYAKEPGSRLVTVRIWTANSANTAANAVACTLPVGYRPLFGIYVQVMDNGTGGPVPMFLDTNGNLSHVLARTTGQNALGYVTFLAPSP